VCDNDNRELVRIQREHGANPNCWNANDDNRITPLQAAAEMHDVTMADMLLAHGADPNAKDHFGRTALMEAADRLVAEAPWQAFSQERIVEGRSVEL